MLLLSASPSLNGFVVKQQLLHFFTTNTWIVLVAFLLEIGLLINALYKKKKQANDENDITNMFTEDGQKNEHLSHREYDITTKVFISIILGFAYIALKSI